ncbi:MAG: radical SAM protein [Planctomycetota bacterium]|jgi:anaerobic magnesium-protoporphyrin IX monomethyl ester cyclase|nr:radical SAM protein [Planctomycetota bacterium]
MRVLFLSPFIAQEPLGVMYLSGALKEAGHETKMIFAPDSKLDEKILEYDPQVVCFSFTTGMHNAILGLNARVKELLPNTVSLCGGAHVTVVPEFIEEPGIDAICRGDGEYAVVNFVDAVEKGSDLTKLPSIWFKDAEGVVHKNEPGPLESDLEKFGFCDRSIIYDAADFYRSSERKVIKTDRGCPMNCSFCFHHAWKKKVYKVTNNEYVRRRSVSHVIAEAQKLKAEYPLTFVHFLDDIFNINNKWLEEFAERWPKEVGVPFDAILMANMVTEKHIKLLKKAGCIYARIAFEAANDHMRNAVMKKNTTRKQLVRAAGFIRQYGIRLGSLNMMGGPGTSIDDDIETILLNIECKVDHPLASLLQPYPMTDINEMTEEMGLATDTWDEFPTLFNRTTSISLPNRHYFENLHKWFPIVVRFPKLLPFARRAIRWKSMSRPFTWMYMLYSEWLVTEQNQLYYAAQGKSGFKTLPPVDYTQRVFTKGFIRIFTSIFGRNATKVGLKMSLNDERVMNHMDD